MRNIYKKLEQDAKNIMDGKGAGEVFFNRDGNVTSSL